MRSLFWAIQTHAMSCHHWPAPFLSSVVLLCLCLLLLVLLFSRLVLVGLLLQSSPTGAVMNNINPHRFTYLTRAQEGMKGLWWVDVECYPLGTKPNLPERRMYSTTKVVDALQYNACP
ncbi:hypothetical protein ONS96_005531 [Cadophora gregata f. sp. sojae]|nr:hypothetical protein ONS96_005531 [Cadophora gregata f. sp. sojae]